MAFAERAPGLPPQTSFLDRYLDRRRQLDAGASTVIVPTGVSFEVASSTVHVPVLGGSRDLTEDLGRSPRARQVYRSSETTQIFRLIDTLEDSRSVDRAPGS